MSYLVLSASTQAQQMQPCTDVITMLRADRQVMEKLSPCTGCLTQVLQQAHLQHLSFILTTNR